MASDIRIPDPVTIKKQEDEDYSINEQGNKIQKEIYKMEEEKLDLLLNQPPGVGDFPSSVDTIDAEFNDGITTKDNEILVTSHLEQAGNEEKCWSDPCPTSIPKEDETEMLDNKKQFHQCDHTGDNKEKEEYEAVVVHETCENSIEKIDEQEALHDIKTNSPVSKVEEDIIVEKEESSNDEINIDQNVEEILDRQTFVDNNEKPQNIYEERNESELELKKEASAESTINILKDDIETVTTNAEDSPCSHGILDEEDGGMKMELKEGDCTEISCDSKVEKVTETSRDTDLEKDEEPSTSNADQESDGAIPEVQNNETTTDIEISAEGKLEMSSVSEDKYEVSKQEGTLETREESAQDNSIPNEGDEAKFSEQNLGSINVEHQVDLQEMTESTTNERREVEELTATATGDYIDGSHNSKAVQDLEYKYSEENDQAEETTSVAMNKGLEENETETPREISETLSNEGERQITNLEASSGIEKEHIEAAYFGASKDDVPTDEELSPSNLNEVHDSANELSDNNGNNVQLEHSLLRETERVEEKVDEVLEFENEKKIQEENNAMTEEEKYVDNISEAYPNTEHTTGEMESLDKTVTSEMISEINSSNVEDEKISDFCLEEKVESNEIRVLVPEELESTEDTETSVQTSTIKDNKTEEQLAVDDALTKEFRKADEEEIVEKSFEEQDSVEATLNLSGEDENPLPNEIEKKITFDNEGSDNIDTENIKEALVKSNDACFSPETNEVDGSSEKEVEKLREEDSGRSILDEADEKYVGEEVIKQYDDENEDIEISKGEVFCEVENVTGEKSITNEKNEEVETQEDVAFSEEHDVLATEEASMEEGRYDSTCPTKEVVADNAIDDTTKNSERAMVAEEVAEKVLDEGKSKEEPLNFLVARESETENLSENDQIISAAEKDIKQIEQKHDSGVELMQPLAIDETETEVIRQNANSETLTVEEPEETKQTETEACFDSTVVAEKDREQILQKDETSEEVKQLEFTNEIDEKASCDNVENETSVSRDDVDQISHQEETKEELEQSLETEKIETEASYRDAEITKLEDYTQKQLEFTNEIDEKASCDNVENETSVSRDDVDQISHQEETKEELEQSLETEKIETEASCRDAEITKLEDYTQKQLEFTNEIDEKASCDNVENETSVSRDDVDQISHQEKTKEELEQSRETEKIETEASCRDAEITKLEDYTQKDLLNEVMESEASCRDIEITVPKEDAEQVLPKEATNDIVQPQAPSETETEVFSENVKVILAVEELQETKTIETEASSDSTKVADKDTESSLEKVETNEEVQQLQLTNEDEEQTICDDAEDTAQILHQDEQKELHHSEEIQNIESEEQEQCKDEEVIATEEDTQPVVLKEVAKELDRSLVTNGNEMDTFSGNSEIEVNEKDTKQISQNIESVEEFENVPETEETETEDKNPVITAKDMENLQKDETREEVQELLLTSELEAKTICDDDERETSVAEDYAEKDSETNLQTYETKEEMTELINANETETEVFHGDIETTLAEKDTDQICNENESTEEIEQYLGIKESNTEGFGDSSGIAIDERNFEETLQKEESREALEQLQASKEIETEAEKVSGNTEIDTVMGERGSEEPFKISESSEKFEESIVTPEPAVERNVDEDIITSIGGEATAKKEVTETARECHENVILDEITSNESRSQETISEEITTEDFQKDENGAIGCKELEIEDVSSIEQENNTATFSSMPVDETIMESCQKENSDTVDLKQELQLELKEQIEEQNSKEISTENIQLQEDTDTKGLDEEIHIEERSENLVQDFFSDSKVNEEGMQEEIQEKEKADSSLVSILSEEKISKEELEIKELSNEEGTDLGTSSINVEEERDSKSEKEKDKDILLVAYETQNQIEYETDDQIHPTTIKNDQESTIEEATLQYTPDDKFADISTLPSKELDTETTEASDATENVTIDAACEDIINEEVENPLKEQEIEKKLEQEAHESITQRDLSEMGYSDISAPSEVQQQRDEELHPPLETENQIEYEADDQVHLTTIQNEQEVIIEEVTLDHTPDYKVTDLSTLTSKEPDVEKTEASNTTENLTVDAEGEDIINEEVENPLKEQEIEKKLEHEGDESITQRDLSEMGYSVISAPSEVQQQRDEELHPPLDTENQTEYEADDQVHLTTIQNDQEVIIEESTLDHTPDYKVTDLSTLTSKELNFEKTEASNTTENLTIDAEGEDIINEEEVENRLKDQEIEKKLVQEGDESITQRDFSEMEYSDISAPSEIQQQRDKELLPPPETDNQMEYEANEQVHLTTKKTDEEVIIEEATLDHTPDHKVAEISNTTEIVTIDAVGECIINEEVENHLKEQEIKNKLVQEADESFTQRDLTEDISAPSEVQQQRDEELHPPLETENQIEYEADDQDHLTTIKKDQEVIIKEATLDHTPDYKITDLSTLTSEEVDIVTETSNAAENVTMDTKGEDIINEEVENPLNGLIENKLKQEADESFIQRDFTEMGSSDIVQSSAPSDVQQQRDEELHPPPEIDRSTFDSNEVAISNKEELIDFKKQHEDIDDKNYLESEEAGEDETKQIFHSEKSEDIEQLLESKITETEAYAAEKDTGEGYQGTEVIETTTECKENVISDETDSTKSQSQETVTEYFQRDGNDAIGYKEPEAEHTSLTEQVNFKENTTAFLSYMPINETTTESSENENSDALKLKQELQLDCEEQIEGENWNEQQKDDSKEAINEEIHVEERPENVAQKLLSETTVYEAETPEGTHEKEDTSSVAITEIDISEMGSDQTSAPSEVANQRDPELHPPAEIDTSTSGSNEVSNLDKEELAAVVDDKNSLQTEELEEVILENSYVVVDEKNNLESEEAAKDDSKDILLNEKSEEEIEQLMETKITVTEALVAEKDTREGLRETGTSVAEKDTTEVLEQTEPCVFEKDSSASNEIENLKKEELNFENEYEIVDDKNNLELEEETSKKEEPSEQPIDQYSIGDKPTSELNMTCEDFEETSRSIELEEATAAAEVASQKAGHDDSIVQLNELPTNEVFDTTSTGTEAKEETIEDLDTIKAHYTEITEMDSFEKSFEDDQAKETNLALNEETSNRASHENYVASSLSEVSDKEVKEDELVNDDCKPSIANYESGNSGLNVAESEDKDMVEDKTVLDSTATENESESEQKDITDVGTVQDFSAEERSDENIESVVEGKEGGEYEMEEKLGILTEDTCTKEGSENLDSTESKVADQDFEEEISINDYDSPSAKLGSEDLSLKAPESKEREAEIKEDQSVMEIRPEDISILCKEKEEDTTTLIVEGTDNQDHNIEETTPTEVEEKISTRSFDFRNDDNLPESVEISSDKHQLVDKVEDIVVRDEASYGTFEPEEKLNNPIEDTCTKEGNENLTASIESKVFDEEIKEEIVSKEEITTSDFDSASTKFESGDLSLKAVDSEEQKIQTINDQSVMEVKPEDNSILSKESTTLAVESMVNEDHDIKETIHNKVIVEENILTRSFDFTSDSNLQETVEIPSSENQLVASETSDEVEKNIVSDEASYGNLEPEATSPSEAIEEKLDATIEDTCIKDGDENLVASPQSKVPDDEIKELISKEEISINDYDSPSTKFEMKDLSSKVDESEEQEIQAKEDQTSIDTKQEDEDIETLAVESTDNKERDIEDTTSKGVGDDNVLIRSVDSTGDNLQDSAEISSEKHELLETETTETVVSEETEHVMDEGHKAVAKEAFLTTSSDTLIDNDCHDSSVVLSQEHLPTPSETIEENVSKSGIDDSPDKFNELELSKGQDEIRTFVRKENDIIQQEDGYNSTYNTLDLGEEKAAIVYREGDQGQPKEVAEIKEKSLLEEKNVEIDDSSKTLECATELANEDQNIQSKMSEAEEDIKQENPTSVEQQIEEQFQEDEITSTEMEATVRNEKVCDEIIKTDSRENNEEPFMEDKSTLEELHVISSQGGINESCEVSEDYTREINSNEKVGTIKSESEEDITSEQETTITDTTQEERVMSECMEPPANISVSIAEESVEKITGEMRNDLEKMHSPSDEATVETTPTSAKAMEADSSFETNAKVAPSLLETQKSMDNLITSNIPFKISAQPSEYEQEVSIDDILSKSKDSELEEKNQGIVVTSLNTEENEYEKTVGESITTENKVPNEEELEQTKFKEDHNQILNEDSNKEDVAEQIDEPIKSTSEVYYQDVVKLSEVIDEGATEKEKADKHRMLEELTTKESFTDEKNNENLKEEETEVDTGILGNTEAITKEKESRVDMSELKGQEDSAVNNIISKDIYQVKEISPEISGKKLNQTEEISEGIETRSVVGDVSPIVTFSPLTEPPMENEGQERQDTKEEDREVKEHDDCSKDNLYEVRAEECISTDLEKVISAKQNQSSIIENELADRTMAENTEQTIKSEEHEDEKIEGAHVGDSGTDEEKGDKHDKDAVSEAPVIVEASKDINVKVGHKKSHNILSGVGSKVKHSISKVRKAITGKSSHHKSESPK